MFVTSFSRQGARRYTKRIVIRRRCVRTACCSSGQVGSREDGSPEPELDAQVRRAFDNLNAILAAANCSFDDVVDVTVFIVDPEAHFQRIWNVMQDYWGEAPHPTATAVGVTWLYGFQFEIKVVARIPD